jgi:putative membrane protein
VSAEMNSPFIQLLVRWLVMALGVTLATKLVNGITCDSVGALITVVVLLSFFNAILKPLLVLFTLPFIIFTLGLGVLVINALLFLFVGRLVEGFHVEGFWPAVWGALVVSITNLLLSGFTRGATRVRGQPPRAQPKAKPDDVIDI